MGPNNWDPDYPVIFHGTAVLRGRIDQDDGFVTVALVGEFDLAAHDAFTTTLTEIEAEKPRAIIVDLGGLTFLDSSALRSLLNAHDRASGSHAFAVKNGSGPAHRIMSLTGLDEELLMITDSRELRDRLAHSPS